MPLPGEIISHRPVLNVLGKSFGAARYLEDYIDTGKNINYYKDCDLMIGEHLNIFGRDVVLTDCDEFTKDYYRKKVSSDINILMELLMFFNLYFCFHKFIFIVWH